MFGTTTNVDALLSDLDQAVASTEPTDTHVPGLMDEVILTQAVFSYGKLLQVLVETRD